LLVVLAAAVALSAAGRAARADGQPCGAFDFDLFVLAGGQARDLTNTPFVCEFWPD
jgi:hypothetical protein